MTADFAVPAGSEEGSAAAGRPLTQRERQLLDLLCEGLSTRETAARLGITVNTARTHIQRILVKLRVHSKAEAVGRALERGCG